MIIHTAGLSKFLGKIRSPEVVYKAEDEDYFIGGRTGVPNVGQHSMQFYDSKPTSNPSYNKFRIFRVEEVDFCTYFVGGVPGNKIYGLMKGDNGSCNKYNAHEDQEKVHVKSAFYLTMNGTNMLIKTLVIDHRGCESGVSLTDRIIPV